MNPGGLLALDIATCVGWAAGKPGERPLYGSRRNGGRPGASVGAILDDYESWLARMLQDIAPAKVFYEAPYLAGSKTINPATVQVLYGLVGITLMLAHRRDVAIESVNINTITKHFTGFSWGRAGRAEKKAATIRMAALYGWKVADDNESDALALFVYAENQVDPVAARQRSAGPLWAQAAARETPLAVPVTQSRIGRRIVS